MAAGDLGQVHDVERGRGTNGSVHVEGSAVCSHSHGHSDAGVSGKTQQRPWQRAAVCVAAASAILCAWLLIAGTSEGLKTDHRPLLLEEMAANVLGQKQEHSRPGYDVNAHLDHSQKHMLTGIFSNEFVAAEKAQHQEEDQEKQQLMKEDKMEERAGLVHLEHDQAAKMSMAAKAADSQLSHYASIYGTDMDAPSPDPRPREERSAAEQATAAKAASDQLSQYASIYDNFMGARQAPLANTRGEQTSRLEVLIKQTESALKGESNTVAAYVAGRGKDAVAGQQLKDILDGSLFQVKSVQDELAHAHPLPPPQAAAAPAPAPAPGPAPALPFKPYPLQPLASISTTASTPSTPAGSRRAPAKNTDGFPSTASMLQKWKQWEAARRLSGAAPPNPEHLTVTSSGGPLVRPWQALTPASLPPAPAPAPAAPVPAPVPAPVQAAAPALPMSVCDEVVRAHEGQSVAMEVACRQHQRCRFDFGAQTCKSV